MLNIGNDVLDFDQVIPDNIIVNIKDWVLVSYKADRLLCEVTSITDSDFEVNVMHKSGNLWKWPTKEEKIFCKWENIIWQINPPAVVATQGQL